MKVSLRVGRWSTPCEVAEDTQLVPGSCDSLTRLWATGRGRHLLLALRSLSASAPWSRDRREEGRRSTPANARRARQSSGVEVLSSSSRHVAGSTEHTAGRLPRLERFKLAHCLPARPEGRPPSSPGVSRHGHLSLGVARVSDKGGRREGDL